MRAQNVIRPVVILAVVVTAVPRGVAQEADQKAAEVIAQARKALGGEQKLGSLTALSLRADYRREMGAGPGGGGMIVMMGGPGGPPGGGGQTTGEIEIDVALPDKYYRQDTGRSGLSMTRIEGFEGDRPFTDLIANSPGMRLQAARFGDDPEREKAAIARSRAELARLLLGLVAGVQPGFAASFTSAGLAESPDGSAHVLDVSGPDGFKAKLFVDTQTHQPLMLTYMEPEARMVRITTAGPGRGRGAPGTPQTGPPPQGGRQLPPDLSPEQRAEIDKRVREAETAPPKLVEHRLYFAEYRDVDGLLLPHRISRESGGKPVEEWEVKSYKVNPSIKPDRFKVGAE
jgi:hypothetical protein